ncbi:MAG: type IV pili methyl-accepting chemotaxis transducer N-terminal domain-containing protein [Sulfurimonas sp.]|nr:type IV pili methyl-accepting chemotaxis transducer N-terminal domain-containing protein [Sulfurimonas sp.]
MKKINKISTKIKLIGALLVFLVVSVLATTIYLNQQNIKDALIINIAGKQRMLTQKIAKNIFYIHYTSNQDFYELNSASDEFIEGLNILKHGDHDKGIVPILNYNISMQLLEIRKLWDAYYEDVQNFKLLTQSYADRDKGDEIVLSIYKNNTILLDNVDKLVTMYTNNSEDKTNFIKTVQYLAGGILCIIFLYSMMQLRSIESHVDSFMQYSKTLLSNKNSSKLSPIKLEAESESEIVEVGDTINCFVEKINSAMEHSNEALKQSEYASSKLEELTDEFDLILGELQDKSITSKHLNNSEDIVIESTEELINSTRKLSNLKKELEKLTKSCQKPKS